MRRRKIFIELRYALAATAVLALWFTSDPGPTAQSSISAPYLLWQYGGCLSGPYCQTGWYASPAVADLDGDGQAEVIWGAADLVALNGSNGSLKWRAPGSSRVWPGIAVADLTGDGTLEVVVGRNSDQLTVYNRSGSPIWTRNPFGSGELRTLAVADLEQDGGLDIIVGHAGYVSDQQVNVFAPDGSVRAGWPARHPDDPGDGGGMWNANVAVADMNNDGVKEVFGSTGSHDITALDRNGNQLSVNAMFAPRQFWSEVGVHVDQAADLRGWVNCGVEHRPNFGFSAPVIADMNGDGARELIVVGGIHNCGTSPYTELYQLPFLFKPDRSRWSGSGFDWTVIPSAGANSAARSLNNYQVIEDVMPNAVAADLDGDGVKEILFPSYDGKVHAYWLDKTEHGSWPYTIPTSTAPGDDFRFASEPVVADLNNDGRAEVIFTSWPKKATGRWGELLIVNDQGVMLHRVSLPAPATGATWNGAMGAPTIANIDSEPGLELVIGTVNSGVAAYDIPNTANARVLWRTGRGDYGRTGAPAAEAPPLETTPPTVAVTFPASGANVKASVTVTANASDNVGVVGVQFRLDGAPLGAEDTSAPFSVTWGTATAANGSHTLTAVARDAAGNSTASAAVTVTVDNSSPTVTITAPAANATVFGSIAVSANAGDNIGVAGVQFFVDGAPLGAEDTSAPYSTTWDTASVANGSHALTARARDGAGNATLSSSASVAVANSTGTTVRIEDGNTAIAYQGSWNVGNTARPWSGGTAAIGFAIGQDAFVSFTGTGITWIGFMGPWAGIASVYVDGAFVATVDGYAPSEMVQAAVFTTSGLPLGQHTLRIEVTRTRNPSSVDYVVIVDAFDILGAPPDTSAPTAVMTSPDGGTTVSGSVPVTANAADDEGVASVTFSLDGAQMAGADTVSPYVVNWNTSTVVDGPHTLIAVARDAAGNETNSAPVTVTVANAAPPDTANSTRIENTDLSIDYTSGVFAPGQPPDWFHGSRSRAWSDGTSSFNRSDGARATLVFTGTAVKWIGFRAAWAGIARVFLDGAFVDEIDLFSPTEEVQVPVFQATDLSPGTHTIAVESTGRRNAEATDYAVVVDAFDISPAFPPPVNSTRHEQTAAAYTSGWTQGDTTRPWSGGTAAVSSGAGERATFVFTGTSVTWIGRRAPDLGIARVYLDGAFQATVDTYFPTSIQGIVYSVMELAPGSHRLEIEVTGAKNTNATDQAIAVDAFDVRSRIEENDAAVMYAGAWVFDDTSRNWSGTSLAAGVGTAARAATAGARVDFTFTGTAVSWVGARAPWAGIADVYLDGVFAQRIDLYSPTEQPQVPVFTASGLSPGPHTLRIDATGEKNPASTTARVVIDAFDVTVPAPAPQVTRVQETHSAITYTSGWNASGIANFWSGENARNASTVGAQATFAFTGTSVRWLGERGFTTGLARVALDGQLIGQIDTRTTFQEGYQATLFTLRGLAAGSHTLTIEVIGRNGEAPGTAVEPIVIDAFDTW